MEFKEPSDIFQYIKKNRWFFALLAGLTFLVYANILDNAFVSDDIGGILNDPHRGNLLGPLLRLNLNEFFKDLIFIIFGSSKGAYHTFSLLLHLLASVLSFFFVAVVTKRKQLAKFSALIFALHPVHTEAVAWISASHYLLYSVLFFLSFLFFHFWLVSEHSFSAVPFLVLYLLAVMTTVWALPLCLVFPFYEIYVQKKKFRWPLYLTLLLFVGVFVLFKWDSIVRRISSVAVERGAAFQNPWVSIPHSLFQYLKLLVWPVKLSFYHEGQLLTQMYLWVARAASLLFLVGVPLLLRKKKRALFFFFLFLIALAPSLSPIQVAWFVAERYVYLASISFCVFLAWFFLWAERKSKWQGLAVFLLILTAAFYSVRTVIRNNDWQSRASLWFATARTNPRSPRVHNNLGDIYTERGDLNKAIEEFEKACQFRPGYADATHNLALTYLRRGDLAEAENYFREALKYEPNLYQSYYMLGVISYEEGNLEKARELFRQALEINPNYTPAHQALQQISKP